MKLLKSKTFYTAILQWLAVLIAYISGDTEVTLWVVIVDFVGMLGLVFYRADMGTNLQNILNGYFQKVAFLKDGVFWTVLIGIIGTITSWLTGIIDLSTMIISVVTAFVLFFIRTGNTPE